MTVTGFHIVAPDRALAWIDTEIYDGDAPAGEANKMMVNATAGIVGIGCGRMALLRRAATALAGALNLAEAICAVQSALSIPEIELSIPPGNARAVPTSVALVGEHAPGRLAGLVLRQAEGFSAARLRCWANPPIDARDVLDVQGVLAAAQSQLAKLQTDIPGATGGKLVLAEIAGGGIHVRALAELLTGSPTRGETRRRD